MKFHYIIKFNDLDYETRARIVLSVFDAIAPEDAKGENKNRYVEEAQRACEESWYELQIVTREI